MKPGKDVHLPALPEGTHTRCGEPITPDMTVAMLPMYANCVRCLTAARHGHEGAREQPVDSTPNSAPESPDQHVHVDGYGHGV